MFSFMKKLNLFLIALVAILFVSCSETETKTSSSNLTTQFSNIEIWVDYEDKFFIISKETGNMTYVERYRIAYDDVLVTHPDFLIERKTVINLPTGNNNETD